MAEIVLQNMNKAFKDFTAVRGLDLTIKDKEFFVLLGPSGCGKTTTLRSISGLETPTKGKIFIEGQDVTKKRASERDIAFVFQLYALYPHLTAYKNIAFPLKSQGMDKEKIRTEVLKVAELLKINHILNKKPKQLSGGDMQRVALGRALVRKPKVFLLDEPIGTLDAAFREEMRTSLKKLHIDVGATTVYVTHDQVEAMSMGDRIAIMNKGELQQVGEPHDVYSNPANLFVAKFIGSPGMNFVSCREKKNSDEGILELNDGKDEFKIDKEIQKLIKESNCLDKELILGVRPEDIIMKLQSEENYLSAEVYVIEMMGAYNIIDVKYGSEILRVRAHQSISVEIGQTVYISFNMRRLRLFDKKTERSIMFRNSTGDLSNG